MQLTEELIKKIEIQYLYGEFLELNNDLDSMVGSRGWLRFAAVSIGSEFVKTANEYQLENKTRKVAKTARA